MKSIKSLWIKADDGSWESSKMRVTGGLESGANWVLADEDDVIRSES